MNNAPRSRRQTCPHEKIPEPRIKSPIASCNQSSYFFPKAPIVTPNLVRLFGVREADQADSDSRSSPEFPKASAGGEVEMRMTG